MPVTWILVANESDARVFKNEGPGKDILLVQKFEHPEGRKRDQDINADRYGRSFSSVGHGRSSMEPQVTPRVHEREVFAHQLVHFLEKEFAHHRFEKLTLMAPPHFLGELRRMLSNGLQKSLNGEWDKDLPSSWITDHELVKMLRKNLNL
jgi:protein required for attachment to host cells